MPSRSLLAAALSTLTLALVTGCAGGAPPAQEEASGESAGEPSSAPKSVSPDLLMWCPIAPIFGAAVASTVPNVTSNPVVADFNRDGNLDVAFTVMNYPTQGLELVLGNGAGGWSTARWEAYDALIADVQTGDFDRDGIPDLVYRNSRSQLVTLLLNADQTIKTTYSASFGGIALHLADLDGDGRQDVVGYYESANALVVAFGVPGGLFGSSRSVTYYLTGGAYALNLEAVGDVNRDGTPDVTFMDAVGNATFYSWQTATSTFTHTTFATGIWTRAPSGKFFQLADLNGDAKLDLVVADANGFNLSAFLGNGDFTFQAAKVLAAQNVATSGIGDVHFADVNHDGRLDMLVEPNLPQIDVYTGNGDGTFAAVQSFEATQHANGVPVFGDFNRDGRTDVVVASPSFAQIYFVPGNY